MASANFLTGSWRGAWLIALVLLASGCVAMPVRGPVVESPADPAQTAPAGVYFDPRPPQPGQTPSEIVEGWLEAMKASPITTRTARGFLTAEAAASWSPERSIRTYADADDPIGGASVRVRLLEVNSYNPRGSWAGRSAEETMRLALEREDGEWRIAQVPDALVVPESWFEDWYRRVTLHRFDPTGTILVPEPVHVPSGEGFASALVRGLLPLTTDDTAVSTTAFPTGTDLLSVPIDAAGVAQVPLSGRARVDEQTAQRMLTQVVWTLRQEARIRAVRLTYDDREIGGPDGATQVNLDVGGTHDPTGADAVNDLFGVRRGRLVRSLDGTFVPTGGPLGSAALGIGAVALNLPGTRAAAVTGEGTALLLSPVETEGTAEQVLSGATELLRPAWDHAGRLWVVDRARGRARVMLVTDSQVRTVDVPGISGERVERILVSRDGTRLVAVLTGADGSGDRVVASRVMSDATGRVVGARQAVPLDLGSDRLSIEDVAWRTTTTLWALSRTTATLSEVRQVSVDGAPTPFTQGSSVRLRGDATALVTSPAEAQKAYVVVDGVLNELGVIEWQTAPPGGRVRSVTYVG